MSKIGEAFNVFNSFMEWKKDYGKNNDKDLYIHRLEDLFEKAEIENNKLNKKLELLNSVEYIEGLYWKKEGKDGPFCPGCFDVNGKLVHINKDVLVDKIYVCPACKVRYEQ